MKRAIQLLMLLGILTSCGKEDEEKQLTPETDTYKLMEILTDPGDGSGTFQPVNSNKTIEFKVNGTVVSNGELCDMSTTSSATTMGTYSYSDSTITSANCSRLPFEISGKHLIISYPCIEPCKAKYESL